MIERLSGADLSTPLFRHLLWLACEVDEARLDRILRDDLPALELWGVRDAGLRAFIAVDPRVTPREIVYIATSEEAQQRGFGRALIRTARANHAGNDLLARTDDDAVEFYRKLGFAVTAAPRDARWPERQRYVCVLPATAPAL